MSGLLEPVSVRFAPPPASSAAVLVAGFLLLGQIDHDTSLTSLHQAEDTPGWSVQMLKEPAVSPLASGMSVVPDGRTTSCNAE